MFSKLNQAGDTIVEVLIAMAVASLVLGVSYAAANQNLLSTRQAQEHSEATEIANEQLEGLVTLISYNDPAIDAQLNAATPVYKCIAISGALTVASQSSLVDPRADETSKYNAQCVRSSAAGYRIALWKDATETFHVLVTWDSISRDTQSSVSVQHKAFAR